MGIFIFQNLTRPIIFPKGYSITRVWVTNSKGFKFPKQLDDVFSPKGSSETSIMGRNVAILIKLRPG